MIPKINASELNRDIKRLYFDIKEQRNDTDCKEFIDKTARREFERLYLADRHFDYMSKESIKIMLRLNLKYRFEPLNMFGIYIDY